MVGEAGGSLVAAAAATQANTSPAACRRKQRSCSVARSRSASCVWAVTPRHAGAAPPWARAGRCAALMSSAGCASLTTTLVGGSSEGEGGGGGAQAGTTGGEGASAAASRPTSASAASSSLGSSCGGEVVGGAGAAVRRLRGVGLKTSCSARRLLLRCGTCAEGGWAGGWVGGGRVWLPHPNYPLRGASRRCMGSYIPRRERCLTVNTSFGASMTRAVRCGVVCGLPTACPRSQAWCADSDRRAG